MDQQRISFEEQSYEIEDFWKPENTTSLDLDRVIELASHIPRDVRSILDVGCGGGILLNHLLDGPKKYDRLCGVDRSLTALKYVNTEKYAHCIENMPFKDNEFDLVSCLEVIEHLPIEIYNIALSEIARISRKYIMISVPNDENLDRSLIKCSACHTHYNPNFHMRSYDKYKLINLLNNHNCDHIDFILIHGIEFCKWRDKFKLNFRKDNNLPPWFSICPVCGLKGSLNKTNNSIEYPVIKKNYLKNIIRCFWPKEVRYQWIAAVYSKRG